MAAAGMDNGIAHLHARQEVIRICLKKAYLKWRHTYDFERLSHHSGLARVLVWLQRKPRALHAARVARTMGGHAC